uniref:Reverse transcriptase domain-containing protein n=1 Tax=Oryzias latipes TaxID=8090 RepID=A0A3P9ILC6_ORYLA
TKRLAPRDLRICEGSYFKRTNMEHNLYADDIFVFAPNSQSSICKTTTLINTFSSVSEYSINWSKSTVLPINCNHLNPSSIKLLTDNISYLLDLFKLNHTQLLKNIEAELRWKTLPFFLIGRVATTKMMILLFSMIPSKPSTIWFQSLDLFISKFIWKGRTPRIRLGLPNFQDYYSANGLLYWWCWTSCPSGAALGPSLAECLSGSASVCGWLAAVWLPNCSGM